MKNFLVVVCCLLFALPLVQADEGMWPFNHVPVKLIKQKHGFEAGADFLARLQKGSIRFNNGGSGSFVSPGGLIMTNHHIASDCIKKLSSKEKDYIADGFYAEAAAAEMKCPDLELNVLMKMDTVTERINAKLKPMSRTSTANTTGGFPR